MLPGLTVLLKLKDL